MGIDARYRPYRMIRIKNDSDQNHGLLSIRSEIRIVALITIRSEILIDRRPCKTQTNRDLSGFLEFKYWMGNIYARNITVMTSAFSLTDPCPP